MCVGQVAAWDDHIWLSGRIHAIEEQRRGIRRASAGRGPAKANAHERPGRKSRRDRDVRTRLRKSVVLVGMMGAGKTAVGTALARALGVPFLDSDEEIEAAADRTIAEIFERDGEAFFRAKESQVLRRLLAGPPAVISTGGGAFLSAENRAAIGAAGVSLWLRAELDVLWNRVRHKSTRPLLRTENPRETLRRLLEARAPVYALADVTVESTADVTVEQMTQRVIEALAARADVLETV
jgi:shikimate kinase